jgi:phage tail-like protein
MAGPTPQSYALEHLFSVKVGDLVVGTFSECSGLGVEYETYDYPEGGNNLFVHRLVGRRKHSNVTLKNGLTNKDALLQWVLGGGAKPVILTFLTSNGAIMRTFGLAAAVPVRWTGPSGNAGANAVATESLEIAHQGLSG